MRLTQSTYMSPPPAMRIARRACGSSSFASSVAANVRQFAPTPSMRACASAGLPYASSVTSTGPFTAPRRAMERLYFMPLRTPMPK